MSTIEQYVESFAEEPGYLDFAAIGPIGRRVMEETTALDELLERSRFGTRSILFEQEERARVAVSTLTGFAPDNVVFQPNTSSGLMHAMFGMTGGVALARSEFPSLTFAAVRAAEALGVVSPMWLETDHGRVTPGNIREQLSSSTAAVAVSLVDARTGYVVDLEGIRQVIGDRLLIVDAVQGFGVVDAPYELADVVVSGGQKWVRAGAGTGFLALSDRALEHLTPVWSGYTGIESDEMPLDEVPDAAKSAKAFRVTHADPIAQARFAAAIEQIAEVGVPALAAAVADRASRVIELADEYAIPLVSSRDERERAGIVVLEPAVDQLTVLSASLHNHGVTVTQREGRIRVSPHASTSEESLDMLRASFLSFATAVGV